MTRTFDTWEYDEIETILGYQRVRNHPLKTTKAQPLTRSGFLYVFRV